MQKSSQSLSATAPFPKKVMLKHILFSCFLCPKCCNRVAMPEVAKGYEREV